MRSTPPLFRAHSLSPIEPDSGASLQTGPEPDETKKRPAVAMVPPHQGARSAWGIKLGKRVKLDSSPDPDPHHGLWKIIGIEQIDQRKQITLFNLGMKLAFGGEAVVKAIIELIAVGEITRECLKPEETQVEELIRLIDEGIVTEAAVQKCIENGAEDLVYLKKVMPLVNAITALIDNQQITPQDLKPGESHVAALARLLVEGKVTEDAVEKCIYSGAMNLRQLKTLMSLAKEAIAKLIATGEIDLLEDGETEVGVLAYLFAEGKVTEEEVQKCIKGSDLIDWEMLKLVASGDLGDVLAGLVEKGKISDDSIRNLTAGHMPTLLSTVLDFLGWTPRSDLSKLVDLKWLKEKAEDRKVIDKERVMPLVSLLEDPRQGLCHHKGKMLSPLDFAYMTRMDFVVHAFTKSPDEGIRKAAETMQRWIDIRENAWTAILEREESHLPGPDKCFSETLLSPQGKDFQNKLLSDLKSMNEDEALALLQETARSENIPIEMAFKDKSLIQCMSHYRMILQHEENYRNNSSPEEKESLRKSVRNVLEFLHSIPEKESNADLEALESLIYGKVMNNLFFSGAENKEFLAQIVKRMHKMPYLFADAEKECTHFLFGESFLSNLDSDIGSEIMSALLSAKQLESEDDQSRYWSEAASGMILIIKTIEWKRAQSKEGSLDGILKEIEGDFKRIEKELWSIDGHDLVAPSDLHLTAESVLMCFDLFLHAEDSGQKECIAKMVSEQENLLQIIERYFEVAEDHKDGLALVLMKFASATMRLHLLSSGKKEEREAFFEVGIPVIFDRLHECMDFVSSWMMTRSYPIYYPESNFSDKEYELLVNCAMQASTELAELIIAMRSIGEPQEHADSNAARSTQKWIEKCRDSLMGLGEVYDESMDDEQKGLVSTLEKHRHQEWARVESRLQGS